MSDPKTVPPPPFDALVNEEALRKALAYHDREAREIRTLLRRIVKRRRERDQSQPHKGEPK